MPIYLLDENVLRELRPGGDRRVLSWFGSVASTELRISVMTIFEKRRGWERRKKAAPALAAQKLAELRAYEVGYSSQIIPINVAVAVEWARLLGAKDKNQIDRALAATARVHNFLLVTRNVGDFAGCDVVVLDPLREPCVIARV